jgi:hypothetical protein
LGDDYLRPPLPKQPGSCQGKPEKEERPVEPAGACRADQRFSLRKAAAARCSTDERPVDHLAQRLELPGLRTLQWQLVSGSAEQQHARRGCGEWISNMNNLSCNETVSRMGKGRQLLRAVTEPGALWVLVAGAVGAIPTAAFFYWSTYRVPISFALALAAGYLAALGARTLRDSWRRRRERKSSMP